MNFRSVVFFIGVLFFTSCNNDNSKPDPTINEIEPDSGPPGTVVSIIGDGFSNDLSSLEVIFNETEADISNASEGEIQVVVPEGAQSGPISVTVGEITTIGPNFTVEAKAPVINSIEPESGGVGTEVLITGMNFSTNRYENIIAFNGSEAPVNGISETELLTEVPEGITDGPAEVTVTVAGKVAQGPVFNVTQPLEEKIIFVLRSISSEVDDDDDIYSINTDGTDQQKLFDSINDESFPIISHDGTKIVFRERNEVDNQLYISNTDGSNKKKLTDLTEFVFTASFSPDDSKIIFSSGTEDDAEIYLVNADGTGLEQITDDDDANFSPEWSPDGAKILFSSYMDGDFEILTMDPDGSNVQKLTDDNTDNRFAKWMPDGTEIVFHSERNGIYGDIYRMEVDGSNVRRITDNNEGATNPHPSPDGSSIVFMKFRDLHVINSDGSGSAIQITNNPNRNNFQIGPPDWALIEEQ